MLGSSLLIAVSRGIALVVLLACTPIVIHYLGTTGYALWEILVSYYAAISLMQVSAGSVSLWKFAKCFDSDHDELLKSFRSLAGMFLAASTVVALVFLTINPIVTSHLSNQVEIAKPLYAIPWMALLGLLATYNQIMLSLITASHRSGTSSAIQSLGTLCTCAASITFLTVEQSIYAMPFGLTIGMCVTFFASNYFIRHSLHVSLPLPAFPEKERLITYSLYATTTMLAGLTVLARDQADRLLTASYFAINEVAHMAISQRVSNSLMELSMVVLIPMSAVVGSLFANNNREECLRVYRRYSCLTTVAIGMASIIIWILHQYLFTLWLGTPHIESTPYLFWGLLGTMIAVSISAPAAVLTRAIGLPRLELYAGIATLILLVLCKPIALKWYGPIGLCACSAICWAIGSITLLLLVNNHMPSQKMRIMHDYRATIFSAIILIACYFLIPIFPTSNRINSAVIILIATPCLAAVYLWCLSRIDALDPSIEQAIMSKLKSAN